MKRQVARIAFWFLFFITLFITSALVGAFFEISSNIDSASIIVLLILALILVGGLFLLYRLYDPFKEKYCFMQETSLLFHKFYCYLFVPVGIFVSILSTCRIFSAVDFQSNSFYSIDLVYRLSYFTLVCVFLVGIGRWKSYAWYALMINYLLGGLYSFASVIICIIFNPYLLSSSLADFMVYIYIASMVCLYYYKRKNLFITPKPIIDLQPVENSFSEIPHATEEISPPSLNSTPVISFCRKCGHKLDSKNNFCSNCGTAIIYEEKY